MSVLAREECSGHSAEVKIWLSRLYCPSVPQNFNSIKNIIIPGGSATVEVSATTDHDVLEAILDHKSSLRGICHQAVPAMPDLTGEHPEVVAR